MNKKIQSILISRKSKVYINLDTPVADGNRDMVAGIIGNFGSLGYVISQDLLEVLLDCSEKELISFYNTIFPILKEQVGAGYYHKPMYPNFPKQVAEANKSELFINAIMHYWGDVTGERVMPVYEKEERFPFCESTNPRFLGLAESEDIENMWMEIFESKASPSVQDKQDIDTFFEFEFSKYANYPSFTNKERMAYVLAKILKLGDLQAFNIWAVGNVKTATDVLRIAVAYSGGDESLTKKTRFGKFSRPVRKILLQHLHSMSPYSVMEDMKRHESAWIRLGEKLHPGEFASKYSNVATCFIRLRNNEIETTNSKIEKFLASAEWDSLIEILQTRPGDFARRFNAIYTKIDNKFKLLAAFKEVADKVSTPVLWQLYGYYVGYEDLCSYRNRIFLPKTPVALVANNNLPKLNTGYRMGVIQTISEALVKRYSTLPSMGKVWIDPVCSNLLIPSGNRSASKALRQVGRGSRFKLDSEKSTVRLFVYWKDTNGYRVDLDLSAVMYGKDWNYKGQCSWTQLRQGKGEQAVMVHSGDITSAPKGASEFLDINLDKLPKDVKYIACNVFCFTGQKMNQLEVGFMGWMARQYPGSGEIYEPKSVEGRCDLTADATSTCPIILDVETKEVIWVDMALTLRGSATSVHNTCDKAIATADLASRMSATRASLMDVFTTHILARNGELVENREDATFVIAEDGDMNPYDIAKFCSDWL